MTERRVGTVKWFDPDIGYGFIERDDDAGDVFVHRDSIHEGEPYRSLQEGQRVEFSLVVGNKGARAEDVVVLPKATP